MSYNNQLEDAEAVEHAYQQLQSLLNTYTEETLEQAAELLEDLPYENPEFGTSNSLQSIKNRLDAASANIGDDMEAQDREQLAKIQSIINNEYRQYPAFGTRRHNGLDARRKNL